MTANTALLKFNKRGEVTIPFFVVGQPGMTNDQFADLLGTLAKVGAANAR